MSSRLSSPAVRSGAITASGPALIGLGLNRIGRVAEVTDTPAIRGMIAKVSHLVRVVHAATELDFFVEAVRAEYHDAVAGPASRIAVRPSGNRDQADRRVPVLLQLRRLRNTAQAEAGRLLRLLLLWDGAVSADAIWHLLRLDFVLRGRRG